MKHLLLTLSLLSSTIAFGKTSVGDHILANEGDSILLSDIQEKEFSIFLSYTGKHFNHCGISISGDHPGLSADRLADSFEIRLSENVAEVSGNNLIAKVKDTEQSRYGEYFKVVTKSGASIREEVMGLTERGDQKLIAEILPCE